MLAPFTLACCAAPRGPSKGTYTLKFPSTAAAVGADTVQLFAFDVPLDSIGFCQNLIQARKRKEPLTPRSENQPVSTCALLFEEPVLNVTYGNTAILALAQRGGVDFMIGCSLQTLGDGDALTPIDLSLVDVGIPVPETTCNSLHDYCTSPKACATR